MACSEWRLPPNGVRNTTASVSASGAEVNAVAAGARSCRDWRRSARRRALNLRERSRDQPRQTPQLLLQLPHLQETCGTADQGAPTVRGDSHLLNPAARESQPLQLPPTLEIP